jgi:sec-independent protein translocase protein TatB
VFGINPSEFIVLVVVAAVVLGPERLPEYAQQLARLVREMRRMAQGASAQVRDELGPEFDDIDWRKLDPRQYDPRRIVREALADVWDPEDPLGLKDDPLGLKDDPLGLKESSRSGRTGDGPDGSGIDAAGLDSVRFGTYGSTDVDSAELDSADVDGADEDSPSRTPTRYGDGPLDAEPPSPKIAFDPDAT